MDFKDEQLPVFNLHSGFPMPRANGDIHAMTADGSRDLFEIVPNSPVGDIHYLPSYPLESEDTVIKGLGENLYTESDDQGLASAMSSLVLARCSLLTKSNQVEMERSDDLMDTFASFFKQRIEDTLEPLRAPVAFNFQRRWEVERKRRQEFLALEEKKLVLRRKMIQLKRHRGGRVRRSTRRAFSSSARTSRYEAKVLCAARN